VTVSPEPEQTPPLRANRDFQLVLGGQGISAFGDAVTLTAMPLLVLFLTGSGALMGLVGALELIPNLLFGLPAGALADRLDRRRLMLWSDAGRAALTFAIPLAYWLGFPTMAVVLAVTVPINMLRVLSDAAYASSIPNLVGREHIARANSYLEASLSVPFIFGPALAGVLVATIGAPETLTIDAASFALSAISLVFVRRPLRADRSAGMPHFLIDIKEGIAFVWRQELIRALIAFFIVVTIATAAILPALSYYLTIDRDFGPELFGFVGSAWSGGYLLGSLVAGRLGPERIGLRMLACSAAVGAALIVIAVSGHSAVYLAAGFVIGGALALQLVSYMTLRAAITPDELLGRVSTVSRTVTIGIQPLGLLAGGALIDATDGGVTLITMGALALGSSISFGLSRRFRNAGQ
jgi:MFS family permease